MFSGEHERFGPADHKIWYTSAISQDSVGRGDSLPVGLIPPPVLESMNGLLDKLGYVQVDESWGTADMPSSLLVPEDGDTDPEQTEEQPGKLPGTEVLIDRLTAGLARFDADLAGRWEPQKTESFTVVIRQPRSAPWVWHVDLAQGKLMSGSPAEDDPDADWSIVGTAEAWLRLLGGELKVSTALRSNQLRYCDYGENDYFVSEARISLLADLLRLPVLADSTSVAGGDVPALADR